ncbi:MAG: glycosyl transferase [Proteobacteria bacterium]|nr:glycosyl transferase [Pseudomonadota bacterium]
MGRAGRVLIPARAHFCWIGNRLPWAYVFAILSAAERSELPEIILHHTDIIEDGAELRALKNAPRVRLSRIDALAYLAETERALGSGGELAALYRHLDSPVMRADILRAAILYMQGGVYLDMDTITTASLKPLLDNRQFIGAELIVWPDSVRKSISPVVWARHLTLDVARKILRHLPNGWAFFRRIEKFYFRGFCNGVMGAQAGAPFFSDYLKAMVAKASESKMQLYGLGPDLLQEVVDRYRGQDLTVCEPDTFYPLPPEISEHWFRIVRTVRLREVLLPETRVVHWYASIRTKSRVGQITPDYVREHKNCQLYSALVCACICHLPDAI